MARNSALRLLHFLSLCLSTTVLAQQIQVTPPAAPPSDTLPVVQSNYYGVSLELSFINYYLGNDTSTLPQPVINYLTALRARTGSNPVRLRLGGNSMDSSVYVPDQAQLIQFTDPDAEKDDQPVTYGKVLFNLMKEASDKSGGAQWLIGKYSEFGKPCSIFIYSRPIQVLVFVILTVPTRLCSRAMRRRSLEIPLMLTCSVM